MLYRVCRSVRVWNNRIKGYVNDISYISDYSPCEIDMTIIKRNTVERKECIK